MPIIVKGGGGSTPPPTQIPEIGYAAITYYGPDGSVWPMTDTAANQYALADGVSGLGAASYTLTADPHPRGGARLRHVQPQPRAIVWPILVKGSDHTDFTDRWRALARAFTSTLRLGTDGVRPPGVLEVARPDGTRRRIEVYYQDGYEGLGRHASGITWDSAVVTLFCEDPYWEDVTPVTVTREQGTGEDFLQPYPSVSSGQVLGATTVHNAGDAVVWPEWHITGPASLVTFTHSGTGESFSLDPNATGVGHGALLAGETVTVSTDPPRVRYQDGSNWVAGLDWPGAVLWGLQPGDNAVTFQLDGAGEGSRVELLYYPRYETA